MEARFELPQFETTRRSQHLAAAASSTGAYAFTVIEYFGFVPLDEAERLGPPDYWDLAWRAAVGRRFNFQITFDRDESRVSRQKARRMKQHLRTVFDHVRLHGDARVV